MSIKNIKTVEERMLKTFNPSIINYIEDNPKVVINNDSLKDMKDSLSQDDYESFLKLFDYISLCWHLVNFNDFYDFYVDVHCKGSDSDKEKHVNTLQNLIHTAGEGSRFWCELDNFDNHFVITFERLALLIEKL